MIKKAFNSKRISTSFRINTVSLEIFFFMNENAGGKTLMKIK